MPHEKGEKEFVYFTGSDFNSNNHGSSMNAGRVRPEVAREMTRRPTSHATDNLTEDSLKVVVRRVSLLLFKPDGYVQPVIDTFERIGIRSCHVLCSALITTRYDQQRATRFTTWFEGASDGLILCHKQLLYFRCASMYMNSRWDYDHEYFQQMIEWEQRVEVGVIGAVITNLCEVIHDGSSSDEGSMPGLQERAREDSLSSEGSSMPPLQERAKEDSSSDEDTKSYGDDGIYDDGESWGYKTFTLKQIIGGDSGGLFPSNCLTLYAFSLHGYAQVHGKRGTRPKSDFSQTKEYIRFPIGLTTT